MGRAGVGQTNTISTKPPALKAAPHKQSCVPYPSPPERSEKRSSQTHGSRSSEQTDWLHKSSPTTGRCSRKTTFFRLAHPFCEPWRITPLFSAKDVPYCQDNTSLPSIGGLRSDPHRTVKQLSADKWVTRQLPRHSAFESQTEPGQRDEVGMNKSPVPQKEQTRRRPAFATQSSSRTWDALLNFLSPTTFTDTGRAYWPRLPHPTCCALRFSQPLDALILQYPSGLIASRCRSWGSYSSEVFLPRKPNISRLVMPLLTFLPKQWPSGV